VLNSSGTYLLAIQWAGLDGTGGTLGFVNLTILASISPPSNVAAYSGDGNVLLTWDEVTGVDGYNVYRSTTSGSGFVQINTAIVSEAVYNDTSVVNGITYYYYLTAVKGLKESAPSTEVNATPSTGNHLPVARFTVYPLSGDVLTAFTFDASSSSDLEDAVGLLEVRWDWENDGTWDTVWSTTKAAAHQYSSNGVKTVKLAVRDTGGLESTTTRTVTVAEAPPVTTVALEGTVGAHNWYVTSVTLNLSATDDISGVNETRYRLNGGAWHSYTGDIVLSNDGTILAEYYSTDYGGFVETVKSVTVKIDKVAPTLALNQTSGFEATVDHVTISWTSSDSTSGVDRFEVSIDGGAFTSVGTTMSHNFQGLADGTHNVTVKSIDAAGNEITQTVEFTIDTSGTGGGASGDLMLYGSIAAVIVLVVVITIVLMMRKRKSSPTEGEEKKVEPPAPPAT